MLNSIGALPTRFGTLHLLIYSSVTTPRGWEYYEVRFENDDFEHVVIPTSGPRLRDLSSAPRSGQPPLVVWSEQGLGDAIQFCRYLNLLEAAGIPFVFLNSAIFDNAYARLDRIW